MTAQRIIVLGAGVIGTTTAYKLAMDGHDVTVIDAEDGVAMMTWSSWPRHLQRRLQLSLIHI